MTAARIQDLDGPLGRLRLAARPEGLVGVTLERAGTGPAISSAPSTAAKRHLEAAARALEAYFRGVRDSFEDLVLAPQGTPFQLRVWTALRAIPFGTITSYGALAGRLGRPGATRAVGGANHHNPLAIVVPCHRVIGADGRPLGYAGGLAAQRWLLEHEGAPSVGQPSVDSSRRSTKAPPTQEPSGIAT